MLQCIICGASEDEVEKLFCFPKNPERSKLWQQSLGMVHQKFLSSHIRVCDKHFERTCFKPLTYIPTLYANAVPTLLPAKSAKVCNKKNSKNEKASTVATETTPSVMVNLEKLRTENEATDREIDNSSSKIVKSQPDVVHQSSQQNRQNSTVNATELTDLTSGCRQHQQTSIELDPLAVLWTNRLNRLNPVQKYYAEKAIHNILSQAELNRLHPRSVRINW